MHVGKTLLTITKFKERQGLEILRVKKLTSENVGKWKVLVSSAPEGALYVQDNIAQLTKRLGPLIASHFAAFNIFTIAQFNAEVPVQDADMQAWLLIKKSISIYSIVYTRHVHCHGCLQLLRQKRHLGNN